MDDHILTAEAARDLQAWAIQRRLPVLWAVLKDQAEYPGKMVARLALDYTTHHLLVAGSIEKLYTLLPPGLVNAGCHSRHRRDLHEIWHVPLHD